MIWGEDLEHRAPLLPLQYLWCRHVWTAHISDRGGSPDPGAALKNVCGPKKNTFLKPSCSPQCFLFIQNPPNAFNTSLQPNCTLLNSMEKEIFLYFFRIYFYMREEHSYHATNYILSPIVRAVKGWWWWVRWMVACTAFDQSLLLISPPFKNWQSCTFLGTELERSLWSSLTGFFIPLQLYSLRSEECHVSSLSRTNVPALVWATELTRHWSLITR